MRSNLHRASVASLAKYLGSPTCNDADCGHPSRRSMVGCTRDRGHFLVMGAVPRFVFTSVQDARRHGRDDRGQYRQLVLATSEDPN